MTLSGGQNASATTDAQGNYSFPNLVSSSSYTVSASLAGVTFYPASFTLTNLPADRTVNFTKAVASYTITDLGVLTSNPVSIAWDVNNAGQVTGLVKQLRAATELPAVLLQQRFVDQSDAAGHRQQCSWRLQSTTTGVSLAIPI